MTDILKVSKATGIILSRLENGYYQVTAGVDVLVETRASGYAEVAFDEAVEERDAGKARRDRERAHFDMQAARSESFARRAANARKKGGKGGRGGV